MPARLPQLQLHIQEIEDFMQTPDYSVNGDSVTRSHYEQMIARLTAEEIRLGGQAIRAAGRSRLTPASFADAGAEGVQ